MIVEFPDDWKPFQSRDESGKCKWDAVNEQGYGYALRLDTEREVEIWLKGFARGVESAE